MTSKPKLTDIWDERYRYLRQTLQISETKELHLTNFYRTSETFQLNYALAVGFAYSSCLFATKPYQLLFCFETFIYYGCWTIYSVLWLLHI